MSTFIDLIDIIRGCATQVAKKYNFKFEPDELVNEAWIRNHNAAQEYVDPPLVMRRAKLDMHDYIRKEFGWKQVAYAKKVNKEKELQVPKFFTNCGTENNYEGRPQHVFDRPFLDKSLLRLENDNLITKIIIDNTDTLTAEAMILYYLDEHSMAETGRLLCGRHESTISSLIKRGREKCYKAIKRMGFEYLKV